MIETKARAGGRPCLFPGKDKPATFTLTADTKIDLARLAAHAGCSRSDFVEALARRFGQQLAEDLRVAAESVKDAAAMDGGSVVPPGGPSGGTD